MDENWRLLIPLLVKAYLEWKYGPPKDPDIILPEESLELHAIDMYTLKHSVTIPVSATQRSAEAVAAAGFLPNAPIAPSIAISFETLKLLRCIRLIKASFSMEAFTKLLCYKYYVSKFCILGSSLSEYADSVPSSLPDRHRGRLRYLHRDSRSDSSANTDRARSRRARLACQEQLPPMRLQGRHDRAIKCGTRTDSLPA